MSSLHRLRVTHPAGEYEVVVGPGALPASAADLAEWCRGRTVFVVSSPRVRGLHGIKLAPLFVAAEATRDLEVPDGEAAKTVEVLARLWEEMLVAGGKRDSRLVAFGGGSVGDVGGFAAACFLRGIEYVQVPTTLLAQVDASVGGKTAVDLPAGKNSVGAFHQPRRVIADTDLLQTLPDAEVRAGLVEVVKMAATLDRGLFGRMEADMGRILDGDVRTLADVVAAAVDAKRRVVEEDPWEGDRRRLLNFGHTLGHALEAVIGYGSIRHGEAVAHGMRFALILARRRGLSETDARRIEAVVDRLDIPRLPIAEAGALIDAMKRDKKAREVGLSWVLPVGLGESRVADDVSWEEVQTSLVAFLAAG